MATVVEGVYVALPPPEGYHIDFENPQRNGETAAYCLFGIGNFICLLFMLQRLYVRAVIQRMVYLEDVNMSLSIPVSPSQDKANRLRNSGHFIRGPAGVHGWEIPFSKFVLFLQAACLLAILYNPVQCGTKMAFLLVYWRLTPKYWFQVTVWITGFAVIGSSVATMLATIFPCKPVRAAWDLSITDGKCIDRNAVYKANAALSAITDVMVLAVPIPVVIPLQMQLKQKIGLICFFGLGGVTAFTSIMRLVMLNHTITNPDQSWVGVSVLLWVFAEANLSCICASLTTVKPFAKHLFPRLLGSSGLQSDTTRSLPNPSTTTSTLNKYKCFDDGSMYPLQTIVDVQARNNGEGNDWNDVRQSSFDGQSARSDKAIVQTRTTTVSYST
ncbi:hypothetical protein EDB80DRAFT_577908 [Ilyonectria destructans]|nr:hypothetical protein EDB80DRAFT_577908 [Ilyonectria destructans]